MSLEDIEYIRRVNRIAENSAKKGFDAFGAILVKNGIIKSSSIDKCIEYSDPTAHAELIVISEYCRKNNIISLEEYVLYCNVEPCVMCSGAIHWSRISKVVFCVSQRSLQKKSLGKLKPSCKDLINTGNSKIEIIGPIIEEEGMSILNRYPFKSKKERHNKYQNKNSKK